MKELSAELLLYDENDPVQREFARWAIGTEPENVGSWRTVQPKISLNPGEVGKLNVFARYVGEQACYIYATDDGEFRDNDAAIWEKSATVRVRLNAIGFERWLVFRLVNAKTFALNPQQ